MERLQTFIFSWGSSFQPLARLAPVSYSDSVSAPRESKTGAHLPAERLLSLDLFRSPNDSHSQVTQITSYWLYLVASDIAGVAPNQLIVNSQSYALPCCSPTFKHIDCNPIYIASTDPLYNTSGISCIPYSRTLPAEPLQCRLGQREQANYVSSFLDASFIYGNV